VMGGNGYAMDFAFVGNGSGQAGPCVLYPLGEG
jgi:hypothetical protein